MSQIEASYDNKKYILIIEKTSIQLKRKTFFSTKDETSFDLRHFAENASFNDADSKIEYSGYIFKIHDVEGYNRLKNTVNEILKKKERMEKLKSEMELLKSRVKALLMEVFATRSWYVAYLNSVDKLGYVDAVYSLPEHVSQTKDPIEAYENLKARLFDKLSELSQALELIDNSRQEKLLKMLQETAAKHDELLKDGVYEKIPEMINNTNSSIENVINELVEEISKLLKQEDAK